MNSILYERSPVGAHPYIDHALSYLEENDLLIEVVDDEEVLVLGSKCAGSFCGATKTLSIAVGVPFDEWFPTLVHEHCHARQYVENPEWFLEMDRSSDTVFHWDNGEEYDDKQLDKAFQDTIILESDCEKRAFAAITEFQLEGFIEPNEYAQKGNAYVQFYQHFRKTRKWYVKTPYLMKEVYSLFPRQVWLGQMPLTDEQAQAFEACTRE